MAINPVRCAAVHSDALERRREQTLERKFPQERAVLRPAADA